MTIHIKATEQYFPMVLFLNIYLYKVVLAFKSVHEIASVGIQINKQLSRMVMWYCLFVIFPKWDFYIFVKLVSKVA